MQSEKEGRNSKNGEINMFLDRFQLILRGFLTTSLDKNSQSDVKLLETWWIWHILGKGTHIYSNQKHPDFHQKSPWTPMSQLSPVWEARGISKLFYFKGISFSQTPIFCHCKWTSFYEPLRVEFAEIWVQGCFQELWFHLKG